MNFFGCRPTPATVTLARAAEIRLDFHADITPDEPANVARTLGVVRGLSGNPLEPTVGEMITAALTPDEARRFVGSLPRSSRRGAATTLGADAYLFARK